MLWKLNFITILVLNSITEFDRKIKNKNICGSENTWRSGTAPSPRDADLKNGSRRKGEREHTCKTTSR
jgi:hypothetical protein